MDAIGCTTHQDIDSSMPPPGNNDETTPQVCYCSKQLTIVFTFDSFSALACILMHFPHKYIFCYYLNPSSFNVTFTAFSVYIIFHHAYSLDCRKVKTNDIHIHYEYHNTLLLWMSTHTHTHTYTHMAVHKGVISLYSYIRCTICLSELLIF